MGYPKVKSVQAIDGRTLVIEFDNKQKKKYDITPLLEREMFSPLRNPVLFNSVQVEQGGYAVVWGKDIDISEHELWRHGQALP